MTSAMARIFRLITLSTVLYLYVIMNECNVYARAENPTISFVQPLRARDPRNRDPLFATQDICLNESISIKCEYPEDTTIHENTTVLLQGNEIVEGADVKLANQSWRIPPSAVYFFRNVDKNTAKQHVTVEYKCGKKHPTLGTVVRISSVLRVNFFECDTFYQRYERPANSNLTLYCVNARMNDRVLWHLDGKAAYYDSYSWKLTNLTEQHIGVYECFAKPDDRPHMYEYPRPQTPRPRAHISRFDLSVLFEREDAPNLRMVNITRTAAAFVWDSYVEITNHVDEKHKLESPKALVFCLASMTYSRFGGQRHENSSRGIFEYFPAENSTALNITRLKPDLYLVYAMDKKHYGKPEYECFRNYHTSKMAGLRFFRTLAFGQRTADDAEVVIGDLNEKIVLLCGAMLPPDLRNITWSRVSKIGVGITQDELATRKGDLGAFVIQNLTRWDLGEYKCQFNMTFSSLNPNYFDNYIYPRGVQVTYSHKLLLKLNESAYDQDTLPSPYDLECKSNTTVAASGFISKIIYLQWKYDKPPKQQVFFKIRYWNRLKHFENSKVISVKAPATEAVLERLDPHTPYWIELVAFQPKAESRPVEKTCLTLF